MVKSFWCARLGRRRYTASLLLTGLILGFIVALRHVVVQHLGHEASPMWFWVEGMITSTGAMVAFFAAIIFTRQRLRDLDLPGSLLLLIPTFAFLPIIAMIVGGFGAYPITPGSPNSDPTLWVGLAMLALVAAAPATPSRPWAATALDWLRRSLGSNGSIGAPGFRRQIGIATVALGLMIVPIFFLTSGAMTVADEWIGTVWTVGLVLLLIGITGLAMRRLRDLGRSDRAAAFLSLFCLIGLPWAVLLVPVALHPRVIQLFFRNPIEALEPIWGLMSLGILGYLMTGQSHTAQEPPAGRA